MIAELERLKFLEFEEAAETMSNLDYCCRVLAGGGTLVGLLRKIKEGCGVELGESALSAYLYDSFEDATVRLREARVEGAHIMVEEAAHIIDDASADSRESLKKAEMQAGNRMLRASLNNRRDYGPPTVQAPQVTVNLGVMHLDALRRFAKQPRPMAALAASSEGAVEVEAEVITDE